MVSAWSCRPRRSSNRGTYLPLRSGHRPAGAREWLVAAVGCSVARRVRDCTLSISLTTVAGRPSCPPQTSDSSEGCRAQRAVDVDRGARHVAGEIGAEEQHDVGHLRRRAVSTQRDGARLAREDSL